MGKRFVLHYNGVHYNGSNSLLFVNATKIYQFKANDSELKDYALCLGNISKDFTVNNTKKIRLQRNCKSFFVYYNAIDTKKFLDIHRHLIKKTSYKTMFGLIKKILIGLLTVLINGSNHTKRV